MRNLHFPVLQLHGILYIIERRGIHLIFAKNKRIFFFKLSLPLLARSCENGPYMRIIQRHVPAYSAYNRKPNDLLWVCSECDLCSEELRFESYTTDVTFHSVVAKSHGHGLTNRWKVDLEKKEN